MKKLLLLLAIITGISEVQAQQSWQWGRRGGSARTYREYESVEAIATDSAGNAYTLSQTNFDGNTVDIAGTPVTGTGYQTIMSSFACNGNLRWTKIIGTGSIHYIYQLRTDGLGGVYVSGRHPTGNSATSLFSIGTDTSFVWGNRSLFLMKFDTNGRFQWFSRPQADTITVSLDSQIDLIVDLDVDAEGNSYLLCHLTKGSFGAGLQRYETTTDTGMHILRYNKSGAFLGGTALAITYNLARNQYGVADWKMARSPSGHYVVTGYLPNPGFVLSVGSTAINKAAFVASFGVNGSLQWLQQSNLILANQGVSSLNKVVFDGAEDIYVCGSIANGDGFGGITFPNPTATSQRTQAPLILKLNKLTGNVVWGKSAHTTTDGFSSSGAYNSNKEFVISGQSGGNLYWPGHAADSTGSVADGTVKMFIARFNSQSGSLVKMDTLGSTIVTGSVFGIQAKVLAADNRGNVYLGGGFGGSLKAGSIVLTGNGSGQYDFFVSKYGIGNCVPSGMGGAPVSAATTSLLLAPNPTATTTQISYQLSGNSGRLEVYDLAGRMLHYKVLNQKGGAEKLSLTNYVPGVYLVVLREAGQVVSHQRMNVIK